MLQSWLEGAGTTEPLFCYVIRLHYYLRTFTRSRYNTKLFDYETQNHPKANISWEKEHTCIQYSNYRQPFNLSVCISQKRRQRGDKRSHRNIYSLWNAVITELIVEEQGGGKWSETRQRWLFKLHLARWSCMHKVKTVVGQFPQELKALKREAKLLCRFGPIATML